MTIGQLSRRTGVPIKVLRDYDDRGFLSTLGRSESNSRLFGEKAVWCVQVIQGLRSLGLTLKEMQAFVTRSGACPDEPISVLLEAQVPQVIARIETQTDLSPEAAVVSVRLPVEDTDTCTIQEDICNDGRFFASRDVASTWPSLHPQAVLLSVEEAAELGRVMARQILAL